MSVIKEFTPSFEDKAGKSQVGIQTGEGFMSHDYHSITSPSTPISSLSPSLPSSYNESLYM